MRTAFESCRIALGFVPPRRLKQLRQLSHLWWGMGPVFICSRGVVSLMPIMSSTCRAPTTLLQLLDLELWSNDGRYRTTEFRRRCDATLLRRRGAARLAWSSSPDIWL